MRVHDPIGGQPDLDRFFDAYERFFRGLAGYEHHLRRLIAGYSRGDGADALRAAFSSAVSKLVEADQESRRTYGDDKRILSHHGRYPAVFRAALVFLAFGLCLHADRAAIDAILRSCDRGDPLLEALARAAAPGSEARQTGPAFYSIFDRLYDALKASASDKAILVKEYLDVWYRDRMEGFPFKDEHLVTDQPDYVGYWCFEAAGVVAALTIDDATFAEHPHYPSDLVAMYRAS